MKEFLGAIAVLWCCVMYWLGGQEIPWEKRGHKWFRRYLLPIGLAIFLVVLGASWWKTLIACSLLAGALHVGYQDKVWKFCVSGVLMGVPSLLISGIDSTSIPLTLLPCLFHSIFGAWSKKVNAFGWSFVAILMGVAIGITYVSAVN